MGARTLLSRPISLKNFSRSALFREKRALNSDKSELFDSRFVKSDRDLLMAFFTRRLTIANAWSSSFGKELPLARSMSELVSVQVSRHSPADMRPCTLSRLVAGLVFSDFEPDVNFAGDGLSLVASMPL